MIIVKLRKTPDVDINLLLLYAHAPTHKRVHTLPQIKVKIKKPSSSKQAFGRRKQIYCISEESCGIKDDVYTVIQIKGSEQEAGHFPVSFLFNPITCKYELIQSS